jgi:prophage regulatory protein
MSEITPRLIRLSEVERLTGLRRSTIYLRISRGEFPAPRRLTTRCSAWLESEIADWVRSRPVAKSVRTSEPNAPTAAT